tara:strand:- start:2541 stop:2831 length:291 start_codon:yes stop_codon:yes gene_type:complete
MVLFSDSIQKNIEVSGTEYGATGVQITSCGEGNQSGWVFLPDGRMLFVALIEGLVESNVQAAEDGLGVGVPVGGLVPASAYVSFGLDHALYALTGE